MTSLLRRRGRGGGGGATRGDKVFDKEGPVASGEVVRVENSGKGGFVESDVD